MWVTARSWHNIKRYSKKHFFPPNDPNIWRPNSQSPGENATCCCNIMKDLGGVVSLWHSNKLNIRKAHCKVQALHLEVTKGRPVDWNFIVFTFPHGINELHQNCICLPGSHNFPLSLCHSFVLHAGRRSVLQLLPTIHNSFYCYYSPHVLRRFTRHMVAPIMSFLLL